MPVNRNLYLSASAVALLAISVAADRAEAACTPASPVNNIDSDLFWCNQWPEWHRRLGSFADTGNTINVLAGASVISGG